MSDAPEKLKNVAMDDSDDENEKKISRICHVCNKGFSSGKAVSGHMRIHGQHYNKRIKQEEQDDDDDDDEGVINNFHGDEMVEKKMMKRRNFVRKMKMVVSPAVCSICGKDFQSMKSLYGHMRSHPARNWRGIHPPPRAAVAVVDLMKALKGWSVTAKRGRKAIGISGEQSSSLSEDTEEEQLHDAAHELILLAHSGGGGAPPSHDDVEFGSSDYDLMMKKSSGDFSLGKDKNLRSNSNSSTRVMTNKRRKKTKLIKLRDLVAVQNADVDHNNRNPPVAAAPVVAEKYKCSRCDKCFPSHQALGGHTSSHNKFKIVIQDSVDNNNENSNSPGELSHAATAASGGGGGASQPHILDFDLNEVPHDAGAHMDHHYGSL